MTISVTLPGTAKGSIQKETKATDTISIDGKKIEMIAMVRFLSKVNFRTRHFCLLLNLQDRVCLSDVKTENDPTFILLREREMVRLLHS